MGYREASRPSVVFFPLWRGILVLSVGCEDLWRGGVWLYKLAACCQKGYCACIPRLVRSSSMRNKVGREAQGSLGRLSRVFLFLDCFLWLKVGCPVRVSKVGCTRRLCRSGASLSALRRRECVVRAATSSLVVARAGVSLWLLLNGEFYQKQ